MIGIAAARAQELPLALDKPDRQPRAAIGATKTSKAVQAPITSEDSGSGVASRIDGHWLCS